MFERIFEFLGREADQWAHAIQALVARVFDEPVEFHEEWVQEPVT